MFLLRRIQFPWVGSIPLKLKFLSWQATCFWRLLSDEFLQS